MTCFVSDLCLFVHDLLLTDPSWPDNVVSKTWALHWGCLLLELSSWFDPVDELGSIRVVWWATGLSVQALHALVITSNAACHLACCAVLEVG
jgi:hypothetical protein